MCVCGRRDARAQDKVGQVLEYFRLATHYDRNWYKAWHSWALANFDVIANVEKIAEGGTAVGGTLLSDRVVPAVHGTADERDPPTLTLRDPN